MEDFRKELLEKEQAEGKLEFWWLSFVNEGGFAGVCVVEAIGLASAIRKTWELEINPSGEVCGFVVPPDTVKPEHYNRLLSKDLLIANDYVKGN